MPSANAALVAAMMSARMPQTRWRLLSSRSGSPERSHQVTHGAPAEDGREDDQAVDDQWAHGSPRRPPPARSALPERDRIGAGSEISQPPPSAL